MIKIVGQTLERFDDDQLIPAFGFGDITTQDKTVRPFGSGPCHGFTEVLEQYTAIIPSVKLSGPTSFVPIINKAIEIVTQTRGVSLLGSERVCVRE